MTESQPDSGRLPLRGPHLRLIDGRTIFFFVHYVEPVLPPPRRASLDEGQSLGLVTATGLSFFIDLTRPIVRQRGFRSTESQDEPDALAQGATLLGDAVRLWLRTCLSVDGVDHPLSRALRAQLARAFTVSVLHEYYLRAAGLANTAADGDAALLRAADCLQEAVIMEPTLVSPLRALSSGRFVAEMVCLWYPCWDRFQFFLGAPFLDRLSDLSSLISLAHRDMQAKAALG